MLRWGAHPWRPLLLVIAAVSAMSVLPPGSVPGAHATPRSEPAGTAAAPSDPLYVQRRQWYLDRVQAPLAWDLLPPGGSTLVAVLDTGVDVTHPDLAANMSNQGCDAFRDQCRFGPSRLQVDAVGHGTFVAGIIAAGTNNGLGIASVSGGRAKVLPIQISSIAGVADSDTIAEAIVYAVDHGARVINISFGGACGQRADGARRRALDYADARDVLIVMSAGNSGGCYEGRFPQNDPRVLNVGATTIADDFAPFTDRGQYVSVAAPGADIVSTVPGGYAQSSGTSFSAPIVAAQAALLFQVPGATKAKVVEWITSTCDPANVYARCGGRVNVYRSVHLAVKGSDPGRIESVAGSPSAEPASGAPATSGAASPPAPAPRPTPPPLPAGFVPSERTRAASLPVAPAGGAPASGWSGAFWPSAPVLPLGLCTVVDGELLVAVDGALTRWNDLVSRGLAWQLERSDSACDGAAADPRIVLARMPGGDGAVPVSLSVVDAGGSACAVTCWASTATLTINASAFDQLDPAGRSAALLRGLVQASGIAAPVTEPGEAEVASLNELLAVTLRALKGE